MIGPAMGVSFVNSHDCEFATNVSPIGLGVTFSQLKFFSEKNAAIKPYAGIGAGLGFVYLSIGFMGSTPPPELIPLGVIKASAGISGGPFSIELGLCGEAVIDKYDVHFGPNPTIKIGLTV